MKLIQELFMIETEVFAAKRLDKHHEMSAGIFLLRYEWRDIYLGAYRFYTM